MRLAWLLLACFACGGRVAEAPSPDGGLINDSSVVDAACSSDLLTDPNNCAVCGHSCAGGACVGGACQPVTTMGDAFALALTDTDVVFDDRGGQVWRMSKSGGARVMIAPALPTHSGNVQGIAVLQGVVYQASLTTNVVRTTTLVGGAVGTASITMPTSIVNNSTDVFVASQQVGVTRLHNGTASTVGPNRPAAAIAVTDNDLFAAYPNSAKSWDLMDVPLQGGPTSVLASVDCSIECDLTTDRTYVFVAQVSSSYEASLIRIDVALPHTATTLGKYGYYGVAPISADDKYVYYTYRQGAGSGVARVKKLFSLPTTLYVGAEPMSALAVDSTAIYFTSRSGVAKIVKP